MDFSVNHLTGHIDNRPNNLFSGQQTFNHFFDLIDVNVSNSSDLVINLKHSSLCPLLMWKDKADLYQYVIRDYINLMLEMSLDEGKRDRQVNPYTIADILSAKNVPFSNSIINPSYRILSISPAWFYQDFYRLKAHVQMGNPIVLIDEDSEYLNVLRIRLCSEIYQSMGLDW